MSFLARPLKWPPVFPLEKGLVLWLPFDDRSGAIAYDRSGKKNHGTLYGPTWVAERRGSALSFNGSTSRVDITTDMLFGTGDFSWLILVKPNLLGTLQTIMGKGSSWNNERWEIRQTVGNAFELMIYDAGVVTFPTSVTTAVVGTWIHIAAVRDGNTGRLYINGAQEDAHTGIAGCSFSGSYPLMLGRYFEEESSFLDGVIAMVLIINRALNATEVKRHAESELLLARH